MTVPQLIGLAKRHGFAVSCKPDGTPVLSKLRADAVMPADAMKMIKDYRSLIVDWFQQNVRQDGETCGVCQASVALAMGPDEAWALCGRVPTRKTPGCPYREF